MDNTEIAKEVFTVYSEKHNIVGYFVKNLDGDAEIIVDTVDGEYIYKGIKDYMKDEWEFIGLL
jgi:hypothetical protein